MARQDKARDAVKTIAATRAKALNALTRRLDQPEELSTEVLAGITKVCGDLHKQEMELRERYPALNVNRDNMDHYARAIRRIVYHSLRCGMDRPGTAARALQRLSGELGLGGAVEEG